MSTAFNAFKRGSNGATRELDVKTRNRYFVWDVRAHQCLKLLQHSVPPSMFFLSAASMVLLEPHSCIFKVMFQ